MDGSSKRTQGFESASERTQYVDVHRCIRKRLEYQYFRAESCFSSPKTFSKTTEAKNRASFFRQLNCGLLYQQGRRHSLLRNVCFGVENSGMVQCHRHPYQSQTYSRESQCDSRFPFQKGQGQTEWSLHPLVFRQICQVWHKPMVGLFATSLNAKLPTYVSPVPDDKAWQIDKLNISWENLDAYAFCPVAILPQLVQKMVTYRCRVIVIAPGWPGMPWFGDLVELSTRIPLRLPQVHNLLKQNFSLRFHKNLEYLNLHAWFLDSCKKIKEDSLLRWQIELRHLREDPQGECMIQGGPFFKSGPRRIRWISPILLSLSS